MEMKCLMSTQYGSDVEVNWNDILKELNENFNIENDDFITLSFEGELGFIQSTAHIFDGKQRYIVEVGNGEVIPKLELLEIIVDSLEEVQKYFQDFYNTKEFPDTTGWEAVKFK